MTTPRSRSAPKPLDAHSVHLVGPTSNPHESARTRLRLAEPDSRQWPRTRCVRGHWLGIVQAVGLPGRHDVSNEPDAIDTDFDCLSLRQVLARCSVVAVASWSPGENHITDLKSHERRDE
jgi:hypothetical protein